MAARAFVEKEALAGGACAVGAKADVVAVLIPTARALLRSWPPVAQS